VTSSHQEVMLLRAIAMAHERLNALAEKMRTSRTVTTTRSEVDVRDYDSGLCVEIYLDAEMSNGEALTWWMDLTWNAHSWVATASLRRTDDSGQTAIRKSTPRPCRNVSEVVEALHALSGELVSWSDILAAGPPDRE